jgi:biotin carboxylase
MSRDPDRHLLLVVGLSGLPAREALAAVLRVTPMVSVVFVTGWVDPEPLRRTWTERSAGGEFRTVGDLDEAVTAALAVHDRQPLAGVVTYSERLLRPHAEIAARLGLRGNTPEAVAIAQSKSRQRAVFAEHGVPSPAYVVLRDETEVPAAVAVTGLPAVFKPSFGAGSQGVTLAGTEADVVALVRQARSTVTALTRLQSEDTFVLEERMVLEGDPATPYADYVSVESLLLDGRIEHVAITDRLRLTHGYVEEGLVQPTRLDPADAAAVIDCADRAVRAVGLTDGAAHTEVALTPDGPKIIEVNARAGGPIPTMLMASAGYDYAAAIARAALGIASAPREPFGAAVWFRFVPMPAGDWRIVAQAPADEIRARFPEVVQLNLRFAVGGSISRHGSQHLGTFTVRGPDLRSARQRAEEVESAIGFRLEPLEEVTV